MMRRLKIKIPTDNENFVVQEHVITGEKVYLVNPKMAGCEWDENNLYFRSSVWDSDGFLISAGFPKFFNYGEKPSLYPAVPTNLSNVECVEKIDGTCLIVSFYRGERIIRTRGTIDATKMPNGDEIAYLRQKYPIAFSNVFLQENYSLIFEWVSPKNVIVLNYGAEPDIFLIGAIRHFDYNLSTQIELDMWASMIKVKRPPRHNFSDLENLAKTVEAFQDQEGVCAYYNNSQNIVKFKGIRYLTLHSFRSECSLNNIVDMYCELNCPKRENIEEFIERNYDFECITTARPHLDSLYLGINSLSNLMERVKDYVESSRNKPKKEFALDVLANMKEDSSLAFHIWDRPNQALETRLLKRLIHRELDKTTNKG